MTVRKRHTDCRKIWFLPILLLRNISIFVKWVFQRIGHIRSICTDMIRSMWRISDGMRETVMGMGDVSTKMSRSGLTVIIVRYLLYFRKSRGMTEGVSMYFYLMLILLFRGNVSLRELLEMFSWFRTENLSRSLYLEQLLRFFLLRST